MTARARAVLTALLLVLLPACAGLPLPAGVRDAADVRGEQADAGGIVVVAPGPRVGTTAVELVTGYLYALSRSPQDDHAIARQFLAPDVECCAADGEAILYPLSTRTISMGADPSQVQVAVDSVARILRDGSYRLEDVRVEGQFSVVDVGGELRLASVPDALWLLEDDLERSFTPYDVHYLARQTDGSPSGRLVPDRVFLPAMDDPAQALVDAVLAGPTRRLAGAVLTAAPPETTAQVRTDGGVVTVDLSASVRELDARARQRLSAQLAWTLAPPVHSALRLLVEGEPFPVEGVQGVQDRDDWPVYDPVGPDSADAPLLYVRDRRLRGLDVELDESPVTTGELPVDAAALSPTTSRLAVLTRTGAIDEVRTGPLEGPFSDPVLRLPRLSSLSWGPADQGLWLLQSLEAGAVVWRVPVDDEIDPQRVSYARPVDAGPLTVLRVSRDGARVALVFGGRLFVGRVEPDTSVASATGLRIADIAPVSRELVGVTDVAWTSGTSLVALGSFLTEEQRFPASVAVDGSSFAVVQRPLVGAVAVELAAAPRRPLVVAADADERRQLYRDNGTLFRLREPGSAPFYPG